MEASNVLICGDCIASVEFIAKSIRQFTNSTRIGSRLEELDDNIVALRTKYYSAYLNIQLLTFEKLQYISFSSSFEGNICILTEIMDNISQLETVADNNVTLKLLILLKDTDNDLRFDSKLEEYTLWSLDNSYELIEISKGNLNDSWDCREKVGFPRLMEALESNTWSSMTKPDSIKDITKNDTIFSFVANSETISDPIQPNTNQEEHNFLKVDGENSLEEDMEENKSFESMDTFLDQAMNWREQIAKGGLDDRERRDKASLLALRLSELMGLDESDDDSDS